MLCLLIQPLSTRLMMTAFLDDRVIQEAVNQVNIFRFLSKPWNEQSLFVDIEKAYEHHEKLVKQNQLSERVKARHTELEELTFNLESREGQKMAIPTFTRCDRLL